MAILILNSDKRNIDLTDILKDVVDELVVLTTPILPNHDKFLYYEEIEDMEHTPYYELRALELHKEYHFHTVISYDEYDVQRAGRIRDRLNISGQSELSGRAYRDKVFMKECLQKDIKVPEFQRLESIVDLRDFIDKHNYPVVVKPIDYGASRGVHVLHNDEELMQFSRLTWENNLEVEKFIGGTMYHVDVLVYEKQIKFVSSSKYVNGCLAFQDNLSVGSVQLHPQENMCARLYQYFEKVYNTLPSPSTSAFHLEVFHTEDDELILCEIASRVGGGYVSDVIKATYNIGMLESLLQYQCRIPVIDNHIDDPELVHGFLLIPPKKGIIKKIPEEIPFSWVTRYVKLVSEGESLEDPAKSVAHIVAITVSGSSSDELAERLEVVDQWFRERVVWDID